MKKIFILILAQLLLNSCETKNINDDSIIESSSIIGTWKLLEGIKVEGNDSIITDYTIDQEMIKIFNKTHFSFLKHDLMNGRDSTKAIFVAGGGKYSIKGKNKIIEHLEYCNYRKWENNSFELEYRIEGDTLITSALEKIDELNVNYINIEKLVKLK